MSEENRLEKAPAPKPEAYIVKPEILAGPENRVEKKAVPESLPVSKPLEKAVPAPAPAAAPADDWQKERAQAIDSILSEDMNEIFLEMKPQEQAAFKKKGEETVGKINRLLSETKVKISKVMDLIRDWLRLIPGVNRFFLEQEVKIKTDKIIKVKNKF